MVSDLFAPDAWTPVDGFDFDDVTYHRSVDHGTVRIAFDRPEVLNAFRPPTVDELYQALDHARQSADVGCVLLTGNGPSEKHGKQTDPDVASFDGGFGSALLAQQVGQKKAREIFFLGKDYSADEAVDMGMANEAVPHEDLESTALDWGETINGKSPTAIRMLKYAFNMADDGLVGQQVFAGEATRLAYMTDEAQEGRDAFLEGREPDWSDVPWHY